MREIKSSFHSIITKSRKFSEIFNPFTHCVLEWTLFLVTLSSVQSLSRVWLFATCPSPAPGVHSDSRPSVSDAIQPSHPLSSPSPPAPNPSHPIPPSIRVFSNESTLCIRWPKYWSCSFSIIPSKEIPRLISFRMDWLDLLALQGNLKSLPQHHSSKASILQRLAFFSVQLSHPYMTTGKTIALTTLTFVGKVGFWICYLGWS